MCTKYSDMASTMYSLVICLVGERAVCVHGAYCQAREMVK